MHDVSATLEQKNLEAASISFLAAQPPDMPEPTTILSKTALASELIGKAVTEPRPVALRERQARPVVPRVSRRKRSSSVEPGSEE